MIQDNNFQTGKDSMDLLENVTKATKSKTGTVILSNFNSQR